MRYLTMATAAAAVSSAVLPYPLSRPVTWLFLIASAVVLTILLAWSLPRDWAAWKATVRRFALPACLVAGVSLLLGGLLLLYWASSLSSFYYPDESLALSIVGLVFTGLGLMLVLVWVVLSVKRRWRGARDFSARSDHDEALGASPSHPGDSAHKA
jgi:hypothetical protein